MRPPVAPLVQQPVNKPQAVATPKAVTAPPVAPAQGKSEAAKGRDVGDAILEP